MCCSRCCARWGLQAPQTLDNTLVAGGWSRTRASPMAVCRMLLQVDWRCMGLQQLVFFAVVAIIAIVVTLAAACYDCR